MVSHENWDKVMKFLVDGMLGKLARWLRLAGHDVAYIGDLKITPSEQDDFLVKNAKTERRTLLTCDIVLHRRARRNGAKSVLIECSNLVDQLVELSKRCGRRIHIKPENSRCPVCNGLLESVRKHRIEEKLPTNVVKTHREFWRCLKCGKIYWYGKHWKTILEMASQYERRMG